MSRSRLATCGLVGLVVMLALSVGEAAQIYYVSPQGSNSNNGSMNSPWRSINYALGHTKPGDTILLKGSEGNFDEWVEIDAGEGGAAGVEKVIAAAPGPMPVLDGIIQIRTSYIRIEGIKIQWKNPGQRAAIGVGGHHVSIVDCDISGPGYWGAIEIHADEVLIEGNTVHDFGHGPNHGQSNLDHGIYVAEGSGITLRDNVVHHNTAYGIHVYDHGGDAITDLVIEGNLVYENGNKSWHKGIIVSGEGGRVEGIRINHNVIWGHNEGGISVIGSNIEVELYNNTIYEDGVGIRVSNVKGLNLKNNLLYQTSTPLDISNVSLSNVQADYTNIFPVRNIRWMGSSLSHSEWVSRGYGIHDVLSDPALKDPANEDFELLPGSSAIDSGVNVGLPYAGNAPDLGASEHFDNPPQILGDVNLDGVIDELDVQLSIDVALGVETDGQVFLRADLNQDGDVDIVDLQKLVNLYLSLLG